MHPLVHKLWLRPKLAFGYVLAKLRFLHGLLPKSSIDQLPLGWNNHMFWTAFKSGGYKVYLDYYCKLKTPDSYEPKVLVDREYRFSQEEIEFFYENGYLGPFDLMSSNEVEQVREHLLNHIHQESSVYSYSQGDYEIQEKKQAARNEDYVFKMMNSKDRHLDNPVLLSIFKNPAITERLAQLLGPDLMLWRTQFFRKYPGGSGTPWHQATTYLSDDLRNSVVYPPDRESLFQLTCWIALTDATKENGCMTIVPGTHKELYPMRTQNYYTKKPGKEQTELSRVEVDYPINAEDVKAIEMKAGQFYIFTERLIHGSQGNLTEDSRWSLTGRIVRPDTKLYSKKMLENSHNLRILDVNHMNLKNWKAVMIRGKDRFGYNRMLEESAKAKGENTEGVTNSFKS